MTIKLAAHTKLYLICLLNNKMIRSFQSTVKNFIIGKMKTITDLISEVLVAGRVFEPLTFRL